MSKNLQALLKEFQENLNQETNQTIRQAKELKSLQKAIAVVAEAEWDNLSDEEKKELGDIINDTESWWYTEVA